MQVINKCMVKSASYGQTCYRKWKLKKTVISGFPSIYLFIFIFQIIVTWFHLMVISISTKINSKAKETIFSPLKRFYSLTIYHIFNIIKCMCYTHFERVLCLLYSCFFVIIILLLLLLLMLFFWIKQKNKTLYINHSSD